MKKIYGLVACFLLFPGSSYAEEFCLSTGMLPTHCKAGDLILVAPKEVPLVCDFSKQIVKMSRSEESPEYICLYTGKALKIKQAPKKTPPPGASNQPSYPPPPRKKNKSLFDNMPFMN